MARDRFSVAEPVHTPHLVAPPADIIEVHDPEKEARLRYILNALSIGQTETVIWRNVCKEFVVPPAQAKIDYADVRDMVRKHLDDEGVIDGVMVGAMARLNALIQNFQEMALAPVTDKVVAIPGAQPGDPDIYRDLTPGEKASEIGARVAAAKVALATNTALTQLVGRRSQRWAAQPSVVIAIDNRAGLSAEDAALLKRLGMDK